MKNFTFAAVLFLAFLTACTNAPNRSMSDASNTSSISQSPVSSEETQKSVADSGGGGGGGGGRIDGSGNGAGLLSQNDTKQNAPAAQISLNQAEQTQTAPTVVERKIIRNADLQLEANAPEEAQAVITKIAETKGGFVVESTQSSSDVKATKRDTVTMTVRVPAAKFDEALSEIRAAASRVIVESVKGQDVTEEFIDVEARLRTQKALEAQFLELMKQSKSVEEALQVQTEIARVRGEIEKVEGRKRFLESQASLSTVKIKLQTPTAFLTDAPGFFNRLSQAFSYGFEAALSFILVLITVLIAVIPFLILIVLPIYLVIRYFFKKNRKYKLADEIAREEIGTK